MLDTSSSDFNSRSVDDFISTALACDDAGFLDIGGWVALSIASGLLRSSGVLASGGAGISAGVRLKLKQTFTKTRGLELKVMVG